MKPTVINNTNGMAAQSPQSQQPTQSQNTRTQPINQSDNNNNQQEYVGNPRGFPHFPHRFDFDDTDDDMFSNMGFGSRMNRMGHPFDWAGRKRRGSQEKAPRQIPPEYEQYFGDDDVDFPRFNRPSWGDSMGSRKQHPTSADRSGFFDYLPPEFRQYIPAEFGFPSRARQYSTRPKTVPDPRVQPDLREHVVHPDVPRRQNLCDAAIQTDPEPDYITGDETDNGNNLQQPGLRNTVDLGQKTAQEENLPNRAQSAPPPNEQNEPQQYHFIPNNEVFSNETGTSMTPQHNQHQKQFFYPQQQQPSSQQKPQPSTAAGDTFVRTVPIVLESRKVPPKNQQTEPSVQQKQQSRPAPFVPTDISANDEAGPPPQTPHTQSCITKIQDIQRDVLDLMCKVEQFSGARGDKEYGYLDEMLTRNLLKLDTIDTNGKDSIRMARKEAIKCIQASIAVLEAKAEINAQQNDPNKSQIEPTTEEGTDNQPEQMKPTEEKSDEIKDNGTENEKTEIENAETAKTDAEREINAVKDIKNTDGTVVQSVESTAESAVESKDELTETIPHSGDNKTEPVTEHTIEALDQPETQNETAASPKVVKKLKKKTQPTNI